MKKLDFSNLNDTLDDSIDYKNFKDNLYLEKINLYNNYFIKINHNYDYDFIDNLFLHNSSRNFKFREDDIVYEYNQYAGITHKIFAPLVNTQSTRNSLLKNGFCSKPVNFRFRWAGELNSLLLNLFETYIVNDLPKSYYFLGMLGCGKTTLLTAIGRLFTIYMSIPTIRFITMPHLCMLANSSLKEDRLELELLKKSAILFIDDMGLEAFINHYQEAIIRDFMCYRYTNDLPCFIAGNNDVRGRSKSGLFYPQLADYLNDSNVFSIMHLQGGSRRN
jgi:hypothetical protein